MPSLIDELQFDASNASIPVTSLLRKALMVAAKLEVSDVPAWINHELSGYPNGNSVPEYRIVYGQLKAKNPFRGWIPAQITEDEINEMVTKRYVTDSIAEIQSVLDREGTIAYNLPPGVQQSLREMFEHDMEFTLVVERARFAGILDEIRNQVLLWAIALDRAGVRGDGLSFSVVEKEKAHNMVLHVEGAGTVNIGVVGTASGQANIATGYKPTAGSIPVSDVSALVAEITKHVENLGLPPPQKQELNHVLEELKNDKDPQPGKIKAALTKMLGMVGQAGQSIVAVGTKAYIEAWIKTHGV